MTKRITKFTKVTHTRNTDTPGVVHTILVPHPPRWDGDEFPFDLTDATQWERQQVIEAWRQAVSDATDMMECAILWLGRLYTPTADPGARASDLTGAGGSVPTYNASRLSARLVQLRTAYDGYQHRLVVEEMEGSKS